MVVSNGMLELNANSILIMDYVGIHSMMSLSENASTAAAALSTEVRQTQMHSSEMWKNVVCCVAMRIRVVGSFRANSSHEVHFETDDGAHRTRASTIFARNLTRAAHGN